MRKKNWKWFLKHISLLALNLTVILFSTQVFAVETDVPLAANQWGVNSGVGSLTNERDNELNRDILKITSNPGSSYSVKYPRVGTVNISQILMSLKIKTTQSFTIMVSTICDDNRLHWVIYYPGNRAMSKGPTNIVAYLGDGLTDGQWHTIQRNIDADLFTMYGIHMRAIRRIVIYGDLGLGEMKFKDADGVKVFNITSPQDNATTSDMCIPVMYNFFVGDGGTKITINGISKQHMPNVNIQSKLEVPLVSGQNRLYIVVESKEVNRYLYGYSSLTVICDPAALNISTIFQDEAFIETTNNQNVGVVSPILNIAKEGLALRVMAKEYFYISVRVRGADGRIYYLYYTANDGNMIRRNQNVYYNIGKRHQDGDWYTVIRDLDKDLFSATGVNLRNVYIVGIYGKRFSYGNVRLLKRFRVPDEHQSIQGAIDAASGNGGGMVSVGAGTYDAGTIARNDIIVLGTGGHISTPANEADDTIINGGGAGTGIRMEDTANFIIKGFTITGCSGSGIYSLRSTNCEILDSYFRDNERGSIGTSSRGGAIYLNRGGLKIINCIFKNNVSNGDGGAIFAQTTNIKVKYCWLENNSTGSYGSAVVIDYSSTGSFENTIVVKNGYGSGAVYIANGSNINVKNCTISDNNSTGLYIPNTWVNVKNCILTGNLCGFSSWGSSFFSEGFLFNNVFGNRNSNYGYPETDVTGIKGNISVDPLFIDSANGNYHLRSNSPCIDTGDPSDYYHLEKNPNGYRIDMGAYGNTTESTARPGAPHSVNAERIYAKIQTNKDHYVPGEDIQITVTAHSDIGLSEISWWAENTGIHELDNLHTIQLAGEKDITNIWTINTEKLGEIKLCSRARDTQYPAAGVHESPAIIGVNSVNILNGYNTTEVTSVTPSSVGSRYPKVVWTGMEYGVVWEYNMGIQTDDRYLENYEVFFCRLDANGDKIGDIIRITNADGYSGKASLVWTGTGYGVAWEDTRDGNGYEIYFARIDTNGNKIGDDVRITDADGYSGGASLVWNGRDYGLCWYDNRDDSHNGEIYFVRIDEIGNKITDDILVIENEGYSAYPRLVWTGEEYGLVWQNYNDNLRKYEIYFCRMDQNGNKVGEDKKINRDGDIFPGKAQLVWSGTRYGVIWEDMHIAGDNFWDELYFIIIDEEGNKEIDDMRLSADGVKPEEATIIWDGNEFVICWSALDQRNRNSLYISTIGNELIQTVELAARFNYSKLTPSIVFTGEEYGIVFADTWNSRKVFFSKTNRQREDVGEPKNINEHPQIDNPKMIWTGDEYSVTWKDKRDGNYEIYFARMSSEGDKIGGDRRITYNDGESAHPDLVCANNEYGIVWQDKRDGNCEIYFAVLDLEGNKIGNDIRVTNSNGASEYPKIIWTGNEYGIIWQDNRDGDYEIYFTILDLGGIEIGNDRKITNNDNISINPEWVYANGRYGIVWQEYTNNGYDIFFANLDSEGNKINEDIRITNNGASEYPNIVWNGNEYGIVWEYNENGYYGIYFTKLDFNGNKVGNDIIIDYDYANSERPILIWKEDRYVLAWSDYYGGYSRIYLTTFNNEGKKNIRKIDAVISYSSFVDSPSLVFAGDRYGCCFKQGHISETRSLYFANINNCE